MTHEEYFRRLEARRIGRRLLTDSLPMVEIGGQLISRLHLDAALMVFGGNPRRITAGPSAEPLPSAIEQFSRPVYVQASTPVHKAPVKVSRRKQDPNKRPGKCITIYSSK